MAIEVSEQLNTMYAEAQKAINQDLRQNFYDAAQTRNQAFRQMNNQANASHSLYSGAPAGMQMQYDQNTFLPGTATLAQQAINRQINNQQSWDEYMEYLKQVNEQIAEYQKQTSNLNSNTEAINNAVNAGNASTSGGLKSNPNAQENFANGQ